MATAKQTSGSKSRSSSKTGAKSDSKSNSKTAKTTPASTAAGRSGKSKQTNSGGSTRIASKQGTSAQSKQAKKASSRTTSKQTGPAKTATSSSKAKTSSSKAASSSKTASSAARNGKSGKKGNGVISKVLDKVSGLLKGEQNAISLLKADHDGVEKLFEKVKANEDGNNAATFKKIKTELETHTHIEETIFYPFLLENGKKDLKDIVREGIEEHGQVKTLLADMDGMSGNSEDFKAKIKVLMENVEHHVQEEENEMFQLVERQVNSEMLKKLGTQMQKEKEKFRKRSVSKAAKPARSQQRAGATA